MALTLPYGRGTQSVDLDPGRLLAEVRILPASALADPAEAFGQAMSAPAGPRLEDVVRRGERVLVITVDHTRPNPSPVLRPLLERLADLGAKAELMIALGNHRAMTEGELEGFFGGGDVAGPVRPPSPCGLRRARDWTARTPAAHVDPPIHQNASREPGQWRVGVTRHGSSMEVSPRLREADRRLVVGFVEPHYIAGFSGGRKLILPGCASRATTTHNHFLTMLHGPQLGRLVGNPMHEDMLDAADAVGVDWTCNIVVNPDDSFHSIHCGDLVAAHEAAVAECERIYATTVPARADLVITSAGGWPYDMDMVQAKKALAPALQCVRPGGAVILVGECRRGWGATEPDRELLDAEAAVPARRRIEEQLARGVVERDWAACSPGALFSRVVHDVGAELLVVSELGDELRGTYLRPAPDLPTALRMAEEGVGTACSVIAIRDGRRAICRVA